jgi:hypothetical protein
LIFLKINSVFRSDKKNSTFCYRTLTLKFLKLQQKTQNKRKIVFNLNSSKSEREEKMATQGTAFWRVAGLSFIQYQLIAASTLRGAMKESARTAQVKSRDTVHFRVRPWDKGTRGDAIIVNNPVNRIAKA